jgi:diaminopropionate ammonia-lyase
MSKYILNKFRQKCPEWPPDISADFENNDILDVHKSLHEYQPTPLIALPDLARELGVGQILVKDEAHRFGLKAFKALGATYAIYCFLKNLIESEGGTVQASIDFYSDTSFIEPGRFTFCTATDGNHGRGVAWTAKKLNQHAVIYMPKNTVPARIKNIEGEGAKVIVVDGNYDDAVAMSFLDAEKNGWQIISDTSWPGYEEIPRWIAAGYTTMLKEIHDDPVVDDGIDIVIVQAGVGALASTITWYYNSVYRKNPVKIISVEPDSAGCLLESVNSPEGKPHKIGGDPNSLMAGLNCGTPSDVAWPFIKQGIDLFLTIPDTFATTAMRRYYYPCGSDPRIISGESGAAGLAALLAICNDSKLLHAKNGVGIYSNSRILLLNTEGATDPQSFEELILN